MTSEREDEMKARKIELSYSMILSLKMTERLIRGSFRGKEVRVAFVDIKPEPTERDKEFPYANYKHVTVVGGVVLDRKELVRVECRHLLHYDVHPVFPITPEAFGTVGRMLADRKQEWRWEPYRAEMSWPGGGSAAITY